MNQRTIAVGADESGNLFAGPSNGFDRGQRQAADSLGVTRVPIRTVNGVRQHAEENLLLSSHGIVRLGTSKRMPCGPKEHDWASRLAHHDPPIEIKQ